MSKEALHCVMVIIVLMSFTSSILNISTTLIDDNDFSPRKVYPIAGVLILAAYVGAIVWFKHPILP